MEWWHTKVKQLLKWLAFHEKIVIAILLACFIYIITRLSLGEGYEINFITSFVCMILTVSIIDGLYKYRQALISSDKERLKIRQHYHLVRQYINEYTQYSQRMISPIDGDDKNISNMKVCDLKNIYNNCLLIIGPLLIPVYQIYFEKLRRLTDVLKILLLVLDSQLSHDLIIASQSFIMENDSDVLYRSIKERTELNAGDATLHTFDLKMLEEYDGPSEYGDPNTINLYIYLYKRLMYNHVKLMEIDGIIERLTTE